MSFLSQQLSDLTLSVPAESNIVSSRSYPRHKFHATLSPPLVDRLVNIQEIIPMEESASVDVGSAEEHISYQWAMSRIVKKIPLAVPCMRSWLRNLEASVRPARYSREKHLRLPSCSCDKIAVWKMENRKVKNVEQSKARAP